MGEDCVHLVFDKAVPFETLQHWPGVEWQKRGPRMLKDLSPEPTRPVVLQVDRQTSQPRRLDRLCNVHLTWATFFIAGDCCASIYDDPQTTMAGIVDWPGLADIAGICRSGQRFAVPWSRLRNADPITGRTMFASSDEPHNWGMWLLCVLPAAVHFVENRQAYDRLFVYADHPNMRAMLRLLGLKAADVVFQDVSRAYHFESIDVFRQPQREFSVRPEAKAMFAKLREAVVGSIVVPSAHHLYFGRRRWTAETGGYRALANEDELIARLVAMGYSPIDPERLGPEEQIELFGSERRIVVLGGAGLFNAVFCKPSTRIIDIESTPNHIDNHSTLLSSVDADYGIILGRVDESDPVSYNRRWMVDIERTTATIAEFMR